MTDPAAPGELPLDSLKQWINAHVAEISGPISVRKFPGGQSNPTFEVTTESASYVLRKKPAGKLLPGAHAVEREYRIISALGALDFPVPKSFGLCEDESVIGTPFYLMEKMEGRIFWGPTLPELDREQRRPAYFDMCDVLARLHQVDPAAAGLSDYGKQGGYISRQIALWTRQYEADETAGRNEHMDRLCRWLPESIPDDGDLTTVVHGDYRCDNLVFDASEPRVIAVLDWELSTLGNPLADFSYHLMKYRTPPGLPAGMSGQDPASLGLPTEQEYVQRYCEQTGRSGIDQLEFYFAYNLWRLAAIIHGIKGRLIRGNASSAKAGAMVKYLEPLAEAAWQQATLAGAE
ncbi:MAG: phosphotransferase family protein [Pseudomonadota bacterium]